MKGRKIVDFFNEYAKTCSPTDFLGQIRRTVNGVAVGEEQVEMIVRRIFTELQLEADDFVLDLCCGNGVLTDRIFAATRGGVGVDFADYLIAIARQYFGGASREFIVADVADYVGVAEEPERFTKVLCYGSFPYLAAPAARALLEHVRERFGSVTRFFIGNLPDKARLHEFYYERAYTPGIENDSESHIGLWRTEQEFVELAASTGWDARVSAMPKEFYAAHYRYDVTLTPR